MKTKVVCVSDKLSGELVQLDKLEDFDTSTIDLEENIYSLHALDESDYWLGIELEVHPSH